MYIIFILFFLFILASFLILWFRGGQKPFPWYEFYARGKQEGFTLKEIILLKKIAVRKKLDKPLAIYWSTNQLNRCLYTVIHDINSDDSLTKKKRQLILDKLLVLRKKAEFNSPKYKRRLRATKNIPPRQKLIIRGADYGTYMSWVVENNRNSLVITLPAGQEGWESLNWTSRKIGVYLWREDDAEYFFETRVQEQVSHAENPHLILLHSDSLRRNQKRDSVRVNTGIMTKFNTMVYSTEEGKKKVQITKKSISGKINNLSETGCRFVAGELLKENDFIKLDFALTDKKRVVAVGCIVNVSVPEDQNLQEYHLKFTKISIHARNSILLYVYNILGEREEEEEQYQRKIS